MPYQTDARLSGRHPFEIFILAFALAVTLPTVLGAAPRPGTVDEALPTAVAFIWSLVMTLGAAVALAGIAWRERGAGLIMEQLGLAAAGLASIVYGGCALYIVGQAAGFPAGLIIGFGASCGWRYFQLQRIINRARSAAELRKDIP